MNVFCTFDDTVICNKECNSSMVAPCFQDDGSTRTILYVQDMIRSGHFVLLLRTVTTGVIVIGLAIIHGNH